MNCIISAFENQRVPQVSHRYNLEDCEGILEFGRGVQVQCLRNSGAGIRKVATLFSNSVLYVGSDAAQVDI